MTALAAIADGESTRCRFSVFDAMTPQRRAAVRAILAQRVKIQIELRQLRLVIVEISRHTLERLETGFFRTHSMAHVFHDSMRAGDANIFFPATRGTSRANVLIDIQTSADTRRIADPSRNFPSQAPSRAHTRHFSLRVQR